jgi:hypothetical protein
VPVDPTPGLTEDPTPELETGAPPESVEEAPPAPPEDAGDGPLLAPPEYDYQGPARSKRSARRPRAAIPIADMARETATILFHHPLPIIGAALLGYSVELTVRVLALRGLDMTKVSDGSAWAIQGLDIVLKILLAGVVIRLAAAAVRKEDLSLSSAYGFAALRLPVYAITALMSYMIIGVGLALALFPGVLAIALFAFWRQAVILDGYGASFALARSVNLARPMIFRLAGLLLLLELVRVLPLVPALWVNAPAMLAAASSGQAALNTALKIFAHRLVRPQAVASVWQMVLDPPALVFMTVWYLRLLRSEAPPETFV